jgi:hypothetical protein
MGHWGLRMADCEFQVSGWAFHVARQKYRKAKVQAAPSELEAWNSELYLMYPLLFSPS